MFLDYTKTEMRIRVEKWAISSVFLKREVTGVMYLPDFLNPKNQMHLLLLNDGQDLAAMQFDQILTHAYQKKNIQPVLTVGITAGDRLQEYGVSDQPDYKGRGSVAYQYRQFITQELLPFIHAQTERSFFTSYYIAGFSLGALSALDIAWHEAKTFSKVGAFSGSFWWRSKDYTEAQPDKYRIAHQIVKKTNLKPELKFWFQTGTQDEKSDRNNNGIIDSIDDTTSLIAELYQKGYEKNKDVKYVELLGGRHDVTTWRKIMPDFLCWAFQD